MSSRWLKRLGVMLAAMMAFVGLPAGVAFAAPVNTWSELVAVVASLNAGESAEVSVDADIEAPADAEKLVVREGTTVTLTGSGKIVGTNAPLITVDKGGALTLAGPTFTKTQFTVSGDLNFRDGAIRDTSVTGPVIFVDHEGSLTISEAAEFANNSVANISGALPEGITESEYAPITAYNGTIRIEGGTLNDNEGLLRGGVIGLWSRDGGTPTFAMSGGTISGNKVAHPQLLGYGGGVYGKNAQVTITGGTIENNSTERGAGLAFDGGAVDLNGGVVQKNDNGEYKGAGGGLYQNGGSLTIDGATFKDNVSTWRGGGIYTQGDAVVEIRGAIITGNSALDSGGGIAFNGTTKATLYAADLRENVSKGFWGGGAMYNDTHTDVTIYNALIRNNTMDEMFMVGAGSRPPSAQGGGVWNCPTGSTVMHVTRGVAIFENSAPDQGQLKGAGDDFASIKVHRYDDPNPVEGNSVIITERMLGGSKRNWYQDGSIYSIHTNWPDGKQVPRYSAEGPNTAIEPNKRVDDNIAFKSVPSDDAKAIAETLAAVRIENNKATRTGISGAGIANNGKLTFGENNPWTLKVTKVWANDKQENRPESLTLDVMLGDKKIETVTLKADNNWQVELANYPDPSTLIDAKTGEKLELTFVEQKVDGYVGHAPKVTYNEEAKTYEVELQNEPSTSIQVHKRWEGDVATDRPDSITVKLLADGNATDHALTLTAANNWEGEFTDLPKYRTDGDNQVEIHYTVTEDEVAGYTSTVTGTPEDGFTITNTKDVPPPTTPPATPPVTPPATPPATPPVTPPSTQPDTPPTTPESGKPLARTGATGSGLLAAAGATLLAAGALLVSQRRRA